MEDQVIHTKPLIGLPELVKGDKVTLTYTLEVTITKDSQIPPNILRLAVKDDKLVMEVVRAPRASVNHIPEDPEEFWDIQRG